MVSNTVEQTLESRGKKYGDFSSHAYISQSIKEAMRRQSGWGRLNTAQEEALEMIAHKIARIINGDPDYKDSWHDIAGYATLVERSLKNE